MKFYFTLFLFLVLIPSMGVSQSDSSFMSKNSGSSNFYLIDGFHFFSFKNLNAEIERFGFPIIKNNHASYGAGGFGTVGRILFGGEGYSTSNTQNNDSGSVRSQGGMGLFYIGYKVINSRHFDLYPMIGGGFGGVTVTFMKDHPDMAFNNFLSKPTNSGQIGMGALFGNLSLGMDYRMTQTNTMILGLRTGYSFSKTTAWKADNFHFVDAPQDPFSHFYIELIIGISIGNDASGY